MRKTILIWIATGSWLAAQQQPLVPTPTQPTTPATGAYQNPMNDNASQSQTIIYVTTNSTGAIAPDAGARTTPTMTPTTSSPNSYAQGQQNPTLVRPVNFAITNTLLTMTPAQANNVIQVQARLNELQSLSVNLGGGQNIQQVVQQNPQLQQQLVIVASQINSLALGRIKPSNDLVQRLSLDLLPVLNRAQLAPDVQLVLAVVINLACNSQNMTPQQIDQAMNNGLVALQSSGAPLSAVHPVMCDLHSIAYELQPNLGL